MVHSQLYNVIAGFSQNGQSKNFQGLVFPFIIYNEQNHGAIDCNS